MAIERQPSRPDSDPAALKAQVLDYRFEAVHERMDGLESELDEHRTETGGKLDSLGEKLSAMSLEVAKGTATLKAYLAAVVLFLTIINVAAAVLGKVMGK